MWDNMLQYVVYNLFWGPQVVKKLEDAALNDAPILKKLYVIF